MATFPNSDSSPPIPLRRERPAREPLRRGGLRRGNLVLQVLASMLHPHEDVPQIRPTGRLRSLGLFSPWVSFTAGTKSFQGSNGIDFFDRWILEPTVRSCSRAIAKSAARSQSAGGLREVKRDDVISVAERLEKHHTNVELVVQEGGVHDDMFIDFFTREKKLGSLTPEVIRWLAG
ncbi:hypothetical protein B0H13DRAFT_2656570 [Mycena leptocephala]|nr:hypothetical protein B0H13DRAFT_2656570 [Mycena leptocephala]